eukprot:TRINITY_DN63515_c0_g1_i1.p1 TRINITY_DN63515_c0_g1~~TRINITY_DN63515_c0_g1_i1.p1  ORF type:complete len:447 (-),score=126.70 TRINITY_DN63515_c0_g1_i1:139-1479(-)
MDNRPSLLLKANREIAEVRDTLTKGGTRLEDLQLENANLLEVSSVLDSEATRQSGHTALAEQQLAELFYKQQDGKLELEEQQASRTRLLGDLRTEINERQQALRDAQAVARKEDERRHKLLDELSNLQNQLKEEDAYLATCKSQIRTCTLASPSFSAAFLASEKAIAGELEANTKLAASHQAEAAASRQRTTSLTAELAAEQTQREALGNQLERVRSALAQSKAKLAGLEADVEARGGDAKHVLSKSAGMAARGEKSAPDRSASLQAELLNSEQQCRSVEQSLKEVNDRNAKDVSRLQSALEDARNDLQRSMREAADAHNQQVANLESEVQAERQRANLEAIGEDTNRERVKRLQDNLSRLRNQELEGPQPPRGGQHGDLQEEIRLAKLRMLEAEKQRQVLRETLLRAEQQHRDAKASGEQQAMQVRSMIEHLWHSIAQARGSIDF